MSSSASRVLSFPSQHQPLARPPRALRLVMWTVPNAVEISEAYWVVWWRQKLECGHRVTAFTPEQRDAKHRQCSKCSYALRLAKRAPIVELHRAALIKKAVSVAILASLIVVNFACAGLRTSIRHHPALYGAAAGAVIGLVIVKATTQTCASTYDGKPYQGTPPCPKPDHTPTGKR